ncbi:MAG: hypothetical protein CMJ25_15115 [Phycisphaerae bacterium]|nr:hypothetical protein [Phycisphaerae bacterium]|tara:strand:- start:1234 stop:1551 length:318 start_codon:yes stop_codon:yes gene_type:complete
MTKENKDKFYDLIKSNNFQLTLALMKSLGMTNEEICEEVAALIEMAALTTNTHFYIDVFEDTIQSYYSKQEGCINYILHNGGILGPFKGCKLTKVINKVLNKNYF